MFTMKKNDANFINYRYPSDHWALDSTKEGTCIGFIKINDSNIYAVKLNPTDSRGYRMLVTFIGDGESDIQSTFNRTYSLSEQKGLSDATTFMVEIFKLVGVPIVQTAQAGNNSHSYDEQNGLVQIGNEREPSMLHTHVWGRGNPAMDYIPGIPLRGPKPGQMFDMMAKTPGVEGNQRKEPWVKNELQMASELFKRTVLEYLSAPEFQASFGSSLQISVWQKPQELEMPHLLSDASKVSFFSSAESLGNNATSTPFVSNTFG